MDFADRTLMGYGAILLIFASVLMGCQTVTISLEPGDPDRKRQALDGRHTSLKLPTPARSFSYAPPEYRPHKSRRGKFNTDSLPTHALTQDFYFFGLLPEVSKIDLQKVCKGKKISFLQTQTTYGNFLIGVLTFGLIFPKTAKIWC